jgi:hypothetical protein
VMVVVSNTSVTSLVYYYELLFTYVSNNKMSLEKNTFKVTIFLFK